MINKDEFIKSINEQGYYIGNNLLDNQFVSRLRTQLELATENDKMLYSTSSGYKDYGMVMLCCLYGGEFLTLFDQEQVIKPFEWVLGEGCIVYAYTSSSMPPNQSNYSSRIHVDSPRLIPNYITNIGATILLDDFTEENGATCFLPRSQNLLDAPTKEMFLSESKRVIAKAGSVFYFNARLLHSGGLNKTSNWRHAVTINMVRSYMKQRIDIPRAMSELNYVMSDNVKQKLGFYSQPPVNLEEYYKPISERSYKQKVE